MTDRRQDTARRDEGLWALTGVLLGVALWLFSDNVAAAVLVGAALSLALAGQERLRRVRGGSQRRASTA